MSLNGKLLRPLLRTIVTNINRLGVGAPLPKDGTDATSATSSAIPEKLRKLLLGKSAGRDSGESPRTSSLTNKAHPVSKRALISTRVKTEDESEEEESRASIIKSKKRLPQQAMHYGDAAPATLPKKLKTNHLHTGGIPIEEQNEDMSSSRNAGPTNVREQLLPENPPGDQPDAAATTKKKRKKRRKQKRAEQANPDK